MFFELSRAGEVESGMAPEGIVEPVDVAANGPIRFLAGVEARSASWRVSKTVRQTGSDFRVLKISGS
jgi:hypothetical protein